MNEQPGVETPELGAELRRYGRILYRQRWWVLGTTAVVFFASLGITALRAARQTPSEPPPATSDDTQTPSPVDEQAVATTRLLIEPPTEVGTAGTSGTADMPTHAQLIASEPIAQRVGDELELPSSPISLLRSLTVTVEPESRVLLITFSDGPKGDVEDVPAAFASAYLRQLEAQERHRLRQEIRLLRRQSTIIERRLEQSTGDITRAALVGRLIEVQNELAGHEVGLLSIDRGRIVGPIHSNVMDPIATSTPPPAPSPSPAIAPGTATSVARNGAAGLFLGLLLGIAVALTRETLDDRLRTRRRVEKGLGVPVVLHHPQVPDVSSFVRFYPVFEKLMESRRSVVVTGLAPPEEVWATAEGLAVAASRAGRNVALVTQHPISMVEEAAGYKVVPAPFPDVGSYETDQVGTFIEDLESASDLVVIDAGGYADSPVPPLLATKDMPVTLVFDGATTREMDARRALDELERAGAAVIGVVLYRADDY